MKKTIRTLTAGRRRRWAILVVGAAGVVASAVVVAPGLGGAASHGTPRQQAAAEENSGSVTPPTLPTFTTIPNPWLQYETNVDPNSAIAFESATDGLKLGAQASVPSLDHYLGSGLSTRAWPGADVEQTTNGGSTWTSVLSVAGGFWGVSTATSYAWAVGVNSLYGTSNDGTTWSSLGEPEDDNLVRVDFSSDLVGVGIGTSGTLYASNDGGASWTAISDGGASYTTSCATGPSSFYVADAEGDVDEVNVGSAAPSTTAAFTPQMSTAGREYQTASLSCDGNTDLEIVSSNDQNTFDAPANYVVYETSDGSTWTPVLSDGATTASPPLGAPLTGSMSPPLVSAVEPGAAIAAALTSTPGTISIDLVGPQDNSSTASGIPDVGSLPGFRSAALVGIASIGTGTAWLDVSAGLPGSTAEAQVSLTSYSSLVFETTNGGSSWSLVSDESEAVPAP
jgi:hypothetical protein